MLNKLKKNKRAIVFTLLALVLSAMFILISTSISDNNIGDDTEIAKIRAGLFSSYYDSFKSYATYTLEISAKACMSEITKYMGNNNEFYSEGITFLDDLAYCMNNSASKQLNAPEGIKFASIKNLVMPSLLDQYVSLTEEDYGIYTDYEITNIQVINYTAKRLKLSVDLALKIYDNNIKLNLSDTEITSDVDFTGTIDPFYSHYLNDEKTITKINIVGEEMYNLRNMAFWDFIQKVEYIQYTEVGISFIDRFINKSYPFNFNNRVISFINDSEVILNYNASLHGHASWVDALVITNAYFNCTELYCYNGNCNDNDFALDSDTYLTLREVYNLTADEHMWGPKC